MEFVEYSSRLRWILVDKFFAMCRSALRNWFFPVFEEAIFSHQRQMKNDNGPRSKMEKNRQHREKTSFVQVSRWLGFFSLSLLIELNSCCARKEGGKTGDFFSSSSLQDAFFWVQMCVCVCVCVYKLHLTVVSLGNAIKTNWNTVHTHNRSEGHYEKRKYVWYFLDYKTFLVAAILNRQPYLCTRLVSSILNVIPGTFFRDFSLSACHKRLKVKS